MTLFALAMNMLVKAAEPECSPLSKSGMRQPPIRAFMDNLRVTTTAVPGARCIIHGLENIMACACMSFKPAKSRSLVLKKGKVTDKFRFGVVGHQIPSVTEKPVKSLGKVFYSTMKDRESITGCTETPISSGYPLAQPWSSSLWHGHGNICSTLDPEMPKCPGRDRCGDREEMEGNRCSPASRNSAEAHGHPWNSGAR